jgi:alpha-L-fucosidase
MVEESKFLSVPTSRVDQTLFANPIASVLLCFKESPMMLQPLCRSFLVSTLFVAAIFSQILTLPTTAHAETREQRDQRMAWWRDARFGMFIHWGLYALPARHEWVRNRERITNEQYQKYFEHFNPDLYNPRDWARMAKQAGMKYVVLTAKHHEGFCLFDSKFTNYKATNTPCNKDLFKEYVEAFRGEGLKVGFYYSLIDWHHPDYTIDIIHPLRPVDKEDFTEENFAKLNQGRDMAKYREYMKNQVRELLTDYGKISIVWFDYSFPGKFGKDHNDWDSAGLLKLARELQPHILVDNRLDLPGEGDFATPEQTSAADLKKKANANQADWERYHDWETCQTFSGSWGYYRDEKTWKTNTQLLTLLITSVSGGGNLLLNVGPTGRGEFDYRAQDRLRGMGEWMHGNSRSIYGCTEAPAEFVAPVDTLYTYNPKTKCLYLHLLKYPADGKLTLPGVVDKVVYTQFLHDASEILVDQDNDASQEDLTLQFPADKPPIEIPVVEIFLK